MHQGATTPNIETVFSLNRKLIGSILRSGVAPSNWYVGVTSNPNVQLFSVHNVAVGGKYLVSDAGNEDVALLVKEIVCLRCNCRSGMSTRDGQSTFVYAYAITNSTRQ